MKRHCLTLFILMMFLAGPAFGAPSPERSIALGKMSPDLQQRLLRSVESETMDGENVHVIVQKTSIAPLDENSILAAGGMSIHCCRTLPFETVVIGTSHLLQLATNPDIRWISPDRTTHGNTVPDFSLLQVTSGASETMNSHGAGIRVAVLDSGITEYNGLDFWDYQFSSRIITRANYVNQEKVRNKDLYGHGSHVAGLIAGSGMHSWNCKCNYAGLASATELVSLRVLDEEGAGQVSFVLEAIDDILSAPDCYGIRIINLSLSAAPAESYKTDPFCLAVKEAVEAGIVVVCSAGNRGMDDDGMQIFGGIGSPGISPYVITVGASNDMGTAIRSDDALASYSSCGPTRGFDVESEMYDNFLKPDLLAPGNQVISVMPPKHAAIPDLYPEVMDPCFLKNVFGYARLSGTSFSTAVVSGAVALMLETNPNLTPSLVKGILMYTAQPLNNLLVYQQGAGMLNVEGALRLAGAVRPDCASLGYGVNLLEDDMLPGDTVSEIAGETVVWGTGTVWVYDDDDTLVPAGGLLWLDNLIFSPDGIFRCGGIQFDDGYLWGDCLNCGGIPGVLWGDCLACTGQTPGVLWGDISLWESAASIEEGVLMVSDQRWEDTVEASNGLLIGDCYGCVIPGVLWGDQTLWVDSDLLDYNVLWGDGSIVADHTFLPDIFLWGDDILAMGEFFSYH